MDIKVIVMDMDGILLNSRKKISSKTKETLLVAQKKGAILIPASGRPTIGLTEFSRELEMEKYTKISIAR